MTLHKHSKTGKVIEMENRFMVARGGAATKGYLSQRSSPVVTEQSSTVTEGAIYVSMIKFHRLPHTCTTQDECLQKLVQSE
jgi:hypothetical protein